MNYLILSALVFYLGLLNQVLASSSNSFSFPLIASHCLSHDTQAYTSTRLNGNIMRRFRLNSQENGPQMDKDRVKQLPESRKIFSAIQRSVKQKRRQVVLPIFNSYKFSRAESSRSSKPRRALTKTQFDESVSANTFIAILPPI